jgi:hypothetical protein
MTCCARGYTQVTELSLVTVIFIRKNTFIYSIIFPKSSFNGVAVLKSFKDKTN